MTNLNQLTQNLPIPKDDGLSDHLLGWQLPSIALPATNGKQIDLASMTGYVVIYCYPMTGRGLFMLFPGVGKRRAFHIRLERCTIQKYDVVFHLNSFQQKLTIMLKSFYGRGIKDSLEIGLVLR